MHFLLVSISQNDQTDPLSSCLSEQVFFFFWLPGNEPAIKGCSHAANEMFPRGQKGKEGESGGRNSPNRPNFYKDLDTRATRGFLATAPVSLSLIFFLLPLLPLLAIFFVDDRESSEMLKRPTHFFGGPDQKYFSSSRLFSENLFARMLCVVIIIIIIIMVLFVRFHIIHVLAYILYMYQVMNHM